MSKKKIVCVLVLLQLLLLSCTQAPINLDKLRIAEFDETKSIQQLDGELIGYMVNEFPNFQYPVILANDSVTIFESMDLSGNATLVALPDSYIHHDFRYLKMSDGTEFSYLLFLCGNNLSKSLTMYRFQHKPSWLSVKWDSLEQVYSIPIDASMVFISNVNMDAVSDDELIFVTFQSQDRKTVVHYRYDGSLASEDTFDMPIYFTGKHRLLFDGKNILRYTIEYDMLTEVLGTIKDNKFSSDEVYSFGYFERNSNSFYQWTDYLTIFTDTKLYQYKVIYYFDKPVELNLRLYKEYEQIKDVYADRFVCLNSGIDYISHAKVADKRFATTMKIVESESFKPLGAFRHSLNGNNQALIGYFESTSGYEPLIVVESLYGDLSFHRLSILTDKPRFVTFNTLFGIKPRNDFSYRKGLPVYYATDKSLNLIYLVGIQSPTEDERISLD